MIASTAYMLEKKAGIYPKTNTGGAGMITFARCKEIFADKEYFEEVEVGESEIDFCRVDMRKLSNTGEHYDFGYRRMPNGHNDVADVFFGKWTPIHSYLVCQNICDEEFLLALIKQCHEVGNL